ncbi:hypothetical protein Tco_0736474, partial [Tanacetum coccineum]
YCQKIIHQLEKISEERSLLVRTLTDAVAKFEEDQTMIDFCKEYKQVFNDAEFNLYESSKDDDSEGKSDGDNDNNNDDDDHGAPTADANKKTKKEEGSEVKNYGREDQDDKKEEKMTGDNKDVIVQMDVDNQNAELKKENYASETKDNDMMNNNDVKNDSVQEKQDGDKNENAKKE